MRTSIPIEATYSMVFTHPKWKITKENYTKTDNISSNISLNRQEWKYTGQSVYSPILLDLADTYNQYTYNNTYNYDIVSNIPHHSIISLGINNLTWETLYPSIRSSITQYYDSQTAETYLEPYDYWHNNN